MGVKEAEARHNPAFGFRRVGRVTRRHLPEQVESLVRQRVFRVRGKTFYNIMVEDVDHGLAMLLLERRQDQFHTLSLPTGRISPILGRHQEAENSHMGDQGTIHRREPQTGADRGQVLKSRIFNAGGTVWMGWHKKNGFFAIWCG